jgi:hypothetical protein
LDFLLEAIPSGWIIRMLEHNAPRAEYDYAGLATPPYMSPNPILISTDFAFRAQDALGWNPRHFQYFASGTQFRQASAAYAIYKTAKPGMPLTAETSAAMSKLLTLSTAASSADLEILDAHLIGGMHDQSLMAATVASHFNATAHIVEQTDARPSPLGTITWMRFRVTFADSSSGKPCGVAKESTPRAQK